jgi:hypothetical protein
MAKALKVKHDIISNELNARQLKSGSVFSHEGGRHSHESWQLIASIQLCHRTATSLRSEKVFSEAADLSPRCDQARKQCRVIVIVPASSLVVVAIAALPHIM